MYNKSLNSLLIYGGSFDPIHQGHLSTALSVQENACFERFIFLPCKQSLLKQPAQAGCVHRVNMLQLALARYPEFKLDTYEITRSGPSYMIETLEYMRATTSSSTAITLLMGLDSFIDLTLWQRWNEILSYSHLMIIARPNYSIDNLNPELMDFMHQHKTYDIKDLLTNPCGYIYLFNAGWHAVSSSFLRKYMHSKSYINRLMPEAVIDYIKEHGLYQLHSPFDPKLSFD